MALGIFWDFVTTQPTTDFGKDAIKGVVNTARTITRRILTLVDQEDEAKLQVYVRQVGYVHMLRQHLRGEWEPSEVEHLLTPEEIASMQNRNGKSSNRIIATDW